MEGINNYSGVLIPATIYDEVCSCMLYQKELQEPWPASSSGIGDFAKFAVRPLLVKKNIMLSIMPDYVGIQDSTIMM